MITREERARELFSKGYNCAQSVFGVFCDDAELSFHTALKLSSGFGGGLRCGEVCGAVSGAVMAIGLKCGFHVEKDFDQKSYCNKKTSECMEKFKQENGSVLCRDLLGADIRFPDDLNNPDLRELFTTVCPRMVASAVRIVESMDFKSAEK